MQNLPSDELTRSCFISEPGYKYIAVDYCAQESIILANFSQDRNLLDFYAKGFEDMHAYVAFLLFPEGIEVTGTIPEAIASTEALLANNTNITLFEPTNSSIKSKLYNIKKRLIAQSFFFMYNRINYCFVNGIFLPSPKIISNPVCASLNSNCNPARLDSNLFLPIGVKLNFG